LWPTTTPFYSSCNHDHVGSCNWYRIRWDLSAHKPVEVWRHWKAGSSHGGPVQSTISPDGRWGAIAEKCQDPGRSSVSEVSLRYGEFGTSGWANEGTHTAERLFRQFPNWYSDETLLFTTKDGEEGTLWGQVDSRTGPIVYSLAGKDGTFNKDMSFKDPNTDLADGTRLVTWSGDGKVGKDKIGGTPLVHNVIGYDRVEFDLGYRDSFGRLLDCEHPAFNPAGDRVLCTQMGGPEGEDPGWNLLYQFAWDGASTWVQDGLLFAPPDEADLVSWLGPVFPCFARDDDSTCQIYNYKLAEWCGSDDYLVATLFCTSEDYFSDEAFKVLMSRVVLIEVDRGTTPATVVGMWDLTAAVEDYEGETRGSYHGINSTCSAPAAAVWP
jgi:hypothetical protein